MRFDERHRHVVLVRVRGSDHVLAKRFLKHLRLADRLSLEPIPPLTEQEDMTRNRLERVSSTEDYSLTHAT